MPIITEQLWNTITVKNQQKAGRVSVGDPVSYICCNENNFKSTGEVIKAHKGLVTTKCDECEAESEWAGLPTRYSRNST